MDQLLTLLPWIYYTCILFLPLMVGANYDSKYRSGSYASRRSSCTFPKEWRGTWFQNGLGDLVINKHSVSHVGQCYSHGENKNHNKYLLLNKAEECFICLAFTPQHKNLLQYKRSYCLRNDNLDEVCMDITGDFTLHTMVKVSGSPIRCPFQGHYSFSYTNGSESKCDDPLSSIEACADNSMFLFNHRRCPRVANSFEKVESFQCIAMWDNGVDHYLYGRFTGPLLTSKESQYRCFMYTLYGSHGLMSMTADATCQGLQTPSLGMNVYSLEHRSEEWPQPRCRFPEFFSSQKEWRDVSGRRKYQILHREEVITVWDIPEPSFIKDETSKHAKAKLRVSCISEIDSVENGQRKKVEMTAYVTDDKCVSSYRCIRLTQRKEGVVNIQIGQASEQTRFLCQDSLFEDTEKHLLIPLAKDGEMSTKPCPLPGIYSYVDPKYECHGILDVGCSRDNEILVDAKCQEKESADVLQCYDNWTEGDRVYLIAGRFGNQRKSADCLVYKLTSKAHELEADPSCTHDRIKLMGDTIGFLMDPPRSCIMATTRPPEIVRPKTQKPKDKKGIYDTNVRPKINSADVLDTHPGSGNQRTTSKYINQSSVRTSDNVLVFLSLWSVLFFFLWR